MADPDDIDKLLAQIDAMNNPGQALTPKVDPGTVVPAAPGKSRSARVQWTAIGAGGAGALGILAGSALGFLPYIGGLQTGLGAALGGAAVALVSGPPTWFHRG